MTTPADLAERLAHDALTALSAAGIATPERGYLAEPECLAGDIARLARARDFWMNAYLLDKHDLVRASAESELQSWMHHTTQLIQAAIDEERERCAAIARAEVENSHQVRERYKLSSGEKDMEYGSERTAQRIWDKIRLGLNPQKILDSNGSTGAGPNMAPQARDE
jgi:hypothetical protein